MPPRTRSIGSGPTGAIPGEPRFSNIKVGSCDADRGA
jgi:hypothetical protein